MPKPPMARSTRTLRTDLPVAVWERLAAEAEAEGVPLGRYVRNLIVRRDARRYPNKPGATA